jgi:hypothetical protein
MNNTAINQETGVEYYTEGVLDGQSVALYVPVMDGMVVNPNGVRWPQINGNPHDKFENYFELIPFTSVPYDAELFVVDSEASGWVLKPSSAAVPDGHPKGTYEYKETIKRRSMAELKALVRGYADKANSQLWPQENGYNEKLAYAEKQIAANNLLPQFLALVERHEKLLSASFHNDARLAQLYREIEAAGETGRIDFVVNQMATEAFPEGWVNGIE